MQSIEESREATCKCCNGTGKITEYKHRWRVSYKGTLKTEYYCSIRGCGAEHNTRTGGDELSEWGCVEGNE